MTRLLLVLFFVGAACSLRSVPVVEAEIDFSDKVVREQSESLRGFLAACVCKGGVYIDKNCQEAAEIISVVDTRWEYHVGMMKYNAKFTKTKPTPTSLPTSAPLCKEASK